jgi:hypothetical protein
MDIYGWKAVNFLVRNIPRNINRRGGNYGFALLLLMVISALSHSTVASRLKLADQTESVPVVKPVPEGGTGRSSGKGGASTGASHQNQPREGASRPSSSPSLARLPGQSHEPRPSPSDVSGGNQRSIAIRAAEPRVYFPPSAPIRPAVFCPARSPCSLDFNPDSSNATAQVPVQFIESIRTLRGVRAVGYWLPDLETVEVALDRAAVVCQMLRAKIVRTNCTEEVRASPPGTSPAEGRRVEILPLR